MLSFEQWVQLGTLISALFAVAASIRNSMKITEIHLLINSRMDKLLELTSVASRAEGVLEGQSKEK